MISNAGKVTTNIHSQGIRFLSQMTGKNFSTCTWVLLHLAVIFNSSIFAHYYSIQLQENWTQIIPKNLLLTEIKQEIGQTKGERDGIKKSLFFDLMLCYVFWWQSYLLFSRSSSTKRKNLSEIRPSHSFEHKKPKMGQQQNSGQKPVHVKEKMIELDLVSSDDEL